MSIYLPYLTGLYDIVGGVTNKTDEMIEEIKKEYYEVTPNLPRKKKKKRRKELNKEYSFWMSVRKWEQDMFNW